MKKIITLLSILVFMSTEIAFAQTVIFTEDFESGTANAAWGTYYANEDQLIAKPMSAAPSALAGGGNYVGLVQDADGSYTGSAVAIAGDLALQDYSIEADVYCYVNNAGGSAYTGLVVYADASKKDFYKIRADFDASDRVNLSGLKSDPNTFMPLFSKDFKGADNAGIYPTTDGWHKMKLEAHTITAGKVGFSVYFDNQLLAGCPIYYENETLNSSGSFGLYSFQMSAAGIAAYFDNIVVTQLAPSAVYDNANVPTEFSLLQNYPNPFNPNTTISYNLPKSGLVSLTIHDLLGRELVSLVSSEQSAGQHSVNWNGKNNFGMDVPSGIYLYSLSSGNYQSTMKMILMK